MHKKIFGDENIPERRGLGIGSKKYYLVRDKITGEYIIGLLDYIGLYPYLRSSRYELIGFFTQDEIQEIRNSGFNEDVIKQILERSKVKLMKVI